MVKTKDEIATRIDNLTDSRVIELLECEPTKKNKDVFFMKMQQARLGMIYKRDRELMKRITSGQTIRVINLITSDEVEKRKYIEASMPEIALLPIEHKR